jgi:hypothetical protein
MRIKMNMASTEMPVLRRIPTEIDITSNRIWEILVTGSRVKEK